MDRSETQRKVYTITSRLLIVSVLALIAVIPAILMDKSPNALPMQAAIGTLIGMGVHLLFFLGILRGIRLTKRQRKINNEINYVLAFGMIVLGFIIMDGAFAFLNQVLFVSIGMFLCVLCDFAAAVVFIVAIFLLRKRKNKKPD
jgi:peptidoglycan/LPS O-acetylase OafA/YrhL